MEREQEKRVTPLNPDRMFEALDEKLHTIGHPMDYARIRTAYEVAREAHKAQKRRDELRRRREREEKRH